MKVFILDDDMAVGTVFVDYLKDRRVDAIHFLQTKLLIRHIEEHGLPDMLVVDYKLADDENSLEVIDRYSAKIPVVALTSAYDDPKIRYSLFRSGACDVKPKHDLKFIFNAVESYEDMI
jgi:DNA-binding response OmpR family regulator